MLRTVRSRVVALTVGVAVISIALTALFVSRSTQNALRDEAELSLERDNLIVSSLADYAFTNADWEAVDDLVRRLATDFDRRIALRDPSGRLIADSDLLTGRQPRSMPRTPAARVDVGADLAAFDVQKDAAGPTIEAVPPSEPPSIHALNDALVNEAMTCLDSLGVPYRVSTESGFAVLDPDPSITAEEYLLFNSCVQPLYEEVAAADIRLPGPLGTTGESFDVPQPAVAPAVQVFLGSRAESGLSLSTLGIWRLLGIATLVLAAASVVAWLLGRQITRPLASLTSAVAGVGSGAPIVRVAATGGDEVSRVGRAFNQMADTLATNEESRRRMVSDIAHELRNPLVTINGTLEAIQDGVYEPTPDVIESIAEETAHLGRLVADLQELANADAGRLKLECSVEDVAAIAGSVVDAHAPLAVAAGVELTCEGAPSQASVDSRRVRQAVANLVGNALRHTAADKSVRVSVVATAEHVQIRVVDEGEGIAPDDLPFVFDRFWRADPSRTRSTGGSGLGLAITREIVHAHGGTITVESTPGTGSTFTIALPVR